MPEKGRCRCCETQIVTGQEWSRETSWEAVERALGPGWKKDFRFADDTRLGKSTGS